MHAGEGSLWITTAALETTPPRDPAWSKNNAHIGMQAIDVSIQQKVTYPNFNYLNLPPPDNEIHRWYQSALYFNSIVSLIQLSKNPPVPISDCMYTSASQ